jgi:hypothetical protein
MRFCIAFFKALLYFLTLRPTVSDRSFFPRTDVVTYPSDPESLISVINSCAWLIEYYKRSGVDPESLQLFRDTMDRAANELAALTLLTRSKAS